MIKVPHLNKTRHGNRSLRVDTGTETPVSYIYILHTHILYITSYNISTMGKDKDKQVDALAGVPTDDDAGKYSSNHQLRDGARSWM